MSISTFAPVVAPRGPAPLSAPARGLRDAVTMLRRDIRHSLRFPMMTVSGMLVPVLLLLLFAGVFGHALRGTLGALSAGGRVSYIDYLTPGILVMTAGFAAEATAVNVCMDMSEGIVARFRTMPISRLAVLTGQVAGSVIRTMISAAVVVGVAVAMGFRSSASPVEWLAAAGIFALLTLALTWLTVAFGLLAKTPAGANSLSLLPAILPFVSSAFIPATAMTGGVRWFATNEPFTPVIDTLRGLLAGTGIGDRAGLAVAWCVGLSLAGYLWARVLYNRRPPAPRVA
jgi:ABC-2 type transport system permease protein